jgi:hypothetical protein
MNKLFKHFAIILIVLMSMQQFAALSYAQGVNAASNQASQQQGTAARYILPGETNAIRMEVNLWGEVGGPGIYVVPSDMDIVGLISSAGGPTEFAKLQDVTIVRAYPQDGEPRIITVDIREFMQTADASVLPSLNPQDVVFVPSTFRKNFATGVGVWTTITAALASIALIYERIERAQRR